MFFTEEQMPSQQYNYFTDKGTYIGMKLSMITYFVSIYYVPQESYDKIVWEENNLQFYRLRESKRL